MIQRRLGRDGPLVGAIGLGCMGLSEFYEPVTERDAIATIHRALECGMTMLDTSDMYGRGETNGSSAVPCATVAIRPSWRRKAASYAALTTRTGAAATAARTTSVKPATRRSRAWVST